MKPSIFNVSYNLDNDNNKLALYNTLTGAVIVLDDFHSKLFHETDKEHAEFVDAMLKGGFFVDKDKDELAEVFRISEKVRKTYSGVSLTIAPTLACNFRCPYCFEEGHRYNTMTDEIVSATIQFINNQAKEKDSVSIAWYGGEPLLRPDIIQKITHGLNVDENKLFGSIITNGYYLDGEMAKFLSEQKVFMAQVTIDGPPDIHNKRRCLPNGSDTFHRILKNVSEAAEVIKINIRVNIDALNKDRVDEVFSYLDHYNLKGKVRLYVAAVENIHGSCNNNTCLIDRDFSAYEAAFYDRNLEKGYSFVYLPSFNPGICGAVNHSMCVIDPLGDLYKCWNEVGMKERSYGSIFSSEYNNNLNKWNNYKFIHSKICKECAFLPICMGGCPYRTIEGLEMQCISAKYNYRQFINLMKRNIQLQAGEKRNEKGS